MLRATALALVCAAVCGWPALADVRRTEAGWELENAALKVRVDETTARLTVTQKGTGLVWEQDDPAPRAETTEDVRVLKVQAPPTIDGDDGDWTRDGVIWLPWVGEDGERNLSGGAYVRWDEHNLYLYVRVRDQAVAFGGQAPQQWWEADSVEFWVDDVQVGLHLYPQAPVAVNAQGAPYAGARIAVKLIEAAPLPGYGVEAAVPIEHFPALKDPVVGLRFYFAVGLNDADPKPGEQVRRVAQGYYPSTWVHSDPRTFAVAVLTDAQGAAPPVSKENDRTAALAGAGVSDMKAAAAPNTLVYSYTAVRRQPQPLPLRVGLGLVGDEPALDITLGSEKGGDIAMNPIYSPPPLYPRSPEAYYMAMADYSDGHYVPVGDERYRGAWLSTSAQLDMPWVAVTDGRQGMMAVVMTPANAVIWMQPRRADKAQLGFPGVLWQPNKGKWGGDRKVRLAFFEQGGHVAACKVYRRIAQENGHFRTLADKARANPNVARLMGAVDWWGAPGVHFVRQAVGEGMRHGLVNGRWAPEDMAEMARLGWLVGEYDNYVDIDDSPVVGPQKAPVKEHAVVQADGELMTAWVHRDENMKPLHTMMKHCTAKQLECAKAIIPGILKAYPYNTRFLDVTPAEGLIECYSPVHPTDMAADMRNREALCRYVSAELGLVAGGEHGRFWDVPYLDYHEGMMGGGFYSWPAGYLRDVTDRKELSEEYMKYGANAANRAPIFELVYHDCVVDYWYWGATNDYLHQVAPEITERNTAMNILYGTPPMMWVNQHGLRWDVPEEREQKLAIYRNVCKLHEIIGMQEMVSHEFLAPDRTVQRTTWEDGTTCTVNFGQAPFRVERRAGQALVLRDNDFYVAGPHIEQWRAPVGMVEGDKYARRTVIRTDGYLFADTGDVPFEEGGLSCVGRVSAELEEPLRARLTLAKGARLDGDISAWRPEWRGLPKLLVALDEHGTPVKRVAEGELGPLALRAPEGEGRYLLLAGAEALAPDVTIAGIRLSTRDGAVDAGKPLRPGDEIEIAATLRNDGLAEARHVTLALTLAGSGGLPLATFANLALAPKQTTTVQARLKAARADGPRRVVARLNAPQPISLTGRAEALADFTGPVDLERFPFRRSYVVDVPSGDSAGMAVEVPFDLEARGTVADPANLRVQFAGGAVAPAQFEPEPAGARTGTLVFCLPPGLPAGRDAQAQVLGLPEGGDAVLPHVTPFEVASDGSRIRMGNYAARISGGVLSSVVLLIPAGERPMAESVIVSSAQTGWSGEEGTVQDFRLVASGPVRAAFECSKTLPAGYSLRRRWSFYADRFEVESVVTPALPTLTRTHYAASATVTNATGRSAKMDGQGQAEGFGFQGTPQWYAVFSADYRNAVIALTPATGFTYWDDGGLGQISLDHGGQGPERRVYVWGPGAPDDGFAKAAAQAYAEGVRIGPAD